MARTGRPKIQIDWDSFDKLCAMMATKAEIANFLEINEDTVNNACKREKKMTFSAYYEQKASGGRISIRRKQYELAMSGNVVMLIWLGKQLLDQSDKLDQKTTATIESELSFKIGFDDESDS